MEAESQYNFWMPTNPIKLVNGGKVLRQHYDGTGHLVIAEIPNNIHHPYVVWRVDSEGNCYLGDYCETYARASQIFEYRLKRNG